MEDYIGLIIGGGILAFCYLWYAGIVRKNNKVKEALGGIDAQLTKRHDLIPNLLKVAQRFMEHEKGLMTEIAELRESANAMGKADNAGKAKELFGIESALQAKLGQFMVRMEAYPDMKSDQAVTSAMDNMANVEEDIAAARRFYNAAVNELNNSIQIFPGQLFAKFANAEPMPFYEAAEATKAPVDASDYLK